jgi:C1A family cysteine protease
MNIKKRLGWRRPLPQKHKTFYFPPRGAVSLPSAVDLSPGFPPVYDQGDLGSCTANAGGAMAQFVMKKTGRAWYMPSRLAIYYWSRIPIDTVNEDSGATLTDTMATMSNWGVPRESLWWYNTRKFTVKPNKKVVRSAANHKMETGLSVQQDLIHIKTCLAEGWPIIFGFAVYQSFEDIGADGIMPMPGPNEFMLGGHAVTAVGYSDAKKMILVRNSWGSGWGLHGYFWMPYDFIVDKDYADDFWTSTSFTSFK